MSERRRGIVGLCMFVAMQRVGRSWLWIFVRWGLRWWKRGSGLLGRSVYC